MCVDHMTMCVDHVTMCRGRIKQVFHIRTLKGMPYWHCCLSSDWKGKRLPAIWWWPLLISHLQTCCAVSADGNYFLGGSSGSASNGSELNVRLLRTKIKSYFTVYSVALFPIPSPALFPIPSPALFPIPSPVLFPIPSPVLFPIPSPAFCHLLLYYKRPESWARAWEWGYCAGGLKMDNDYPWHQYMEQPFPGEGYNTCYLGNIIVQQNCF